MGKQDSVAAMLAQWSRERPEMDTSPLGIVVRIDRIAKLLDEATSSGLAGLGLKHWEYDVLSALRRQGEPFELTASALARATLLTSGGMTARIDGLVRRGLVVRRRDPADRRSLRVRLTPAGLELADRALAERLSAVAAPLAALEAAGRRELAAALEALLVRLEQPRAA